jgi:hypothetical protein
LGVIKAWIGECSVVAGVKAPFAGEVRDRFAGLEDEDRWLSCLERQIVILCPRCAQCQHSKSQMKEHAPMLTYSQEFFSRFLCP